MTYSYRYEFHPHGTTVSKVDKQASHIWVDNGNTLDMGIFDHHQSSVFCCTVETIISNRHLLASLEPDQDNTFTFHTHHCPDADALFSIFLIQYYLEHRDSKCDGTSFPLCSAAILDYVRAIDTGRVHLNDTNSKTLVSLYCILAFVYELERDSLRATQRALLIIRHAAMLADQATADCPFDFFTSPITNIDCTEELKCANEDYVKYQADKATICQTVLCALPLENETVSLEKVNTLYWQSTPTCQFNRLWARQDGYPLTIIPGQPSEAIIGNQTHSCENVIISIDPALNDNRETAFSLFAIAQYLELYEQALENKIYTETGFLKRDHSTPRGYRKDSDSIFLTAPFSETADPWFINADHTLIAAPRSGSLLSLHGIIQVVTQFSNHCLEGLHNNLIIPFCFSPDKFPSYKEILKDLAKPKSASSSVPYLREDVYYLNNMVSEFSNNHINYAHFALPLSDRLMQDLQSLNTNYEIYNTLQVFLFQYGVGFFILSASRSCETGSLPTFVAMKNQRTFRMQIDAYFKNTLSKDLSLLVSKIHKEDVRILNSHFYTYAKLSPENSAVTDTAIATYASLLCSVTGEASDDCQITHFNYHQHMAYSRIGCAFVSAAFQKETPLSMLYENEWFWLYLLILEQRYVLLECKRKLVQFKLNQQKEIRNLQEMLIDFSASGFFSTVAEDEIGDHMYQQLSEEVFMLGSLKDEILGQLEQVSGYHESKVSASLDRISVWILPFMVLSTILQCSLITMEPLIGVSKKGFPFALTSNIQAFASWGIMILLIILLFILLKITDRHRK